jgi:hypothetical protein
MLPVLVQNSLSEDLMQVARYNEVPACEKCLYRSSKGKGNPITGHQGPREGVEV